MLFFVVVGVGWGCGFAGFVYLFFGCGLPWGPGDWGVDGWVICFGPGCLDVLGGFNREQENTYKQAMYTVFQKS